MIPEPGQALPFSEDEMWGSQTTPEEDQAAVCRAFLKSVEPPPNPWLQSPRRERAIEPSELPSELGEGDPLDEELDEPESELAKSAAQDPHSRRTLNLVAFIKSRLALGQSVDDLVKFAEQHDPRTAADLREAAALIK